MPLKELEVKYASRRQRPYKLLDGGGLHLLAQPKGATARISEVAQAKSAELVDGVWAIPALRAKNARPHSIALGPWGRSLMLGNHEWVSA